MIPCSEEDYFYKLDNMVLSSGQYLRQVFKERWKTDTGGEDWQDESDFITKFISGPGEQAFRKAPPFQKTALKASSSVEDWDISLLTLVLQNFGSETKYERENGAVNELKKLRNDLAHHSTRKFTQEEYNDKVETFRGSLRTLGMKVEDVEKLVDRAGLTSSLKALERVKLLYQEAGVLMKKGNFGKAIERYSDAITTPSLLPVNLGEAYENRANCYLKSVKNKAMDGEHCKQALMDVQQALEMNPNSWRAYYLAAQCHRRKNDLSQAIKYYERTLRMSPAQKVVKSDLDSCKVLAGVQSRHDHMNPQLMPMNMQERLDHLENETGLAMSEKEFIHFSTEQAGKVIKGQDHVFRGHQYCAGWSVPQDYTEAVKHYAKADKVGNPEGSYNLAQCYHYGRGVKQDVMEALKIYRRVAEMDAKIFGQTTKLKRNVGVAGSQHAIGLLYEYGIGVEKNYKEAAVWYKRAMENGVGQAANNLGILYSRGQGVPLDEKMAELCWKQGVVFQDVNAASALVSYYLEQLEPDKASDMLRIGREMGNASLISMPNEECQRALDHIRARRSMLEPDVLEFEKDNKLDTKGLTFKQRLERTKKFDPTMEVMHSYFESLMTDNDLHGFGDKVMPDLGKLVEAVKKKTRSEVDKPLGILDRKEYLKSTLRQAMILEHRKHLKDMAPKSKHGNLSKDTKAPKLKQCVPRKMADMKPITLHQMNPTEDKIFENRILELTIIDDPNPYWASIHLIAEDENGDSTRLYIYNVKRDKETLENFQAGCRVGLINPYMRIGAMDITNGIRNDEPKCIIYLEGVKSMCRFCGEENASLKCSKCKRPYCSKECQKLDWKKFDHKLICSLKL